MTEGQFSWALMGQGNEPCLFNGHHTRIKYVVADAFDDLARDKHAAGRPDRAGLLRYIAGELRHGNGPSKKSIAKAKREIAEIERRLIDGVPLIDSPNVTEDRQ